MGGVKCDRYSAMASAAMVVWALVACETVADMALVARAVAMAMIATIARVARVLSDGRLICMP